MTVAERWINGEQGGELRFEAAEEVVFGAYGLSFRWTVFRKPSKSAVSVGCKPERKQSFSADPFYGRARCPPMVGALKTQRS